MRAGVVINPISGVKGRARNEGARRTSLARAVAARLNVDANVALTERRGHGAELARAFIDAGCNRVVAWGGDGTVNEIAGPVIGSRAALGIVPAGSGDGLARSLGLSAPPERALEIALGAPVAPVDVGYLGDRHFLNVAGIGFDAAVGAAFNARGKRGLRGYIRPLFTMVWTYQAQEYALTLDGAASRQRRLLVAFANGREYGNRMVLAPAADPSDGWLDTVLVESGSPVTQIWRMRRLSFGHGRPARGVAWGRCRAATVSAAHLMCHVDGETFETSGTIEVRIAPGAIEIAGVRSSASRDG
jgi:diacylglycerol kinase (ATP)